jgi:hypothetical protein
MKEFLLLFRGGDGRTLKQSPEKWQAHMQRWMAWMGELTKQGKFVAAQPLGAAGKQITGTKKVVTDGPYIEGKEIVGGYLICKAGNFDEAVEISRGCPILEFDNGIVEVREIQPEAM